MKVPKFLICLIMGILSHYHSNAQSGTPAIDKDVKYATLEYCISCGIPKVAFVMFDNGVLLDIRKIAGVRITTGTDDTTVIRNINAVCRHLKSQGFELITSNTVVEQSKGYNPFPGQTLLFYFKRND